MAIATAVETGMRAAGAGTAGRSAAVYRGASGEMPARIVGPEQDLFLEGDPADAVFQLLSGVVRLYKLFADGRRQIIGFVTAPAYLGLGCDDVHHHSAETVTSAAVRRHGRAAFDAAAERDAGFSRSLLGAARAELNAAYVRLTVLGRNRAEERVAAFVLEMRERLPRPGADGAVTVPMNRRDVADYLGLTPETVCRVLRRFQREGLICMPAPDRIQVRDEESLRRMHDGDGED